MVVPGTFPAAFKVLKNLAALPDPFVWALEIVAPDGTALYGPDLEKVYAIRLTAHTVPFVWGTISGGFDKEWWPVQMGIEPIAQSGDGSLHEVGITCSNAFGLAQLWLSNNDGLKDHQITLYVLNIATLNDPEAAYSFTGKITGTSATLNSVTISMSAGAFGFGFGKQIITTNCGWVYRSAECGFQLDQDGAILGPCVFTEQACTLRGDLEEALSQPRRHPKRFGGFIGIPRGGASSG